MVLVSDKSYSIYRTLQTNGTSFLGLQSSDDSSTLGGVTSLRGEESRMMTVEFLTALFSAVDEQLRAIPQHPEAHLWPSEVVTLGLLHALKGVGNRPFYRWLTRAYRPLFPRLPPSAPGSFVSSRPIRTGRGLSWPPRPCSGSSTPTASS